MVMSLLWNSGFTKEVKRKLLGEVLWTASFLYDIVPTMRSKTSAEELWHGKKNGWLPKYLIEFSRAGMVTILDKKVNEIQKKARPIVMVGYAKKSHVDTYRMWNHVTNRIILTDSVKWSNFTSLEIKEESRLSKISEDAKKQSKDGLETYDEMGVEDTMKSQGIAQVEPLNEDLETAEQVEQPRVRDVISTPILRRSNRIKELNTRIAKKVEQTKAAMTNRTNKFTGNTTMIPLVLDEGNLIIES